MTLLRYLSWKSFDLNLKTVDSLSLTASTVETKSICRNSFCLATFCSARFRNKKKLFENPRKFPIPFELLSVLGSAQLSSALLCYTLLCSVMRIVNCFWCGWPFNAIITPEYTKLDFESCHIKVAFPNWNAVADAVLADVLVSAVYKTTLTHTHTQIHPYLYVCIEEVELLQSTCANPIKHSSYGAFICNCCRLLFNALGPGQTVARKRWAKKGKAGEGEQRLAILGTSRRSCHKWNAWWSRQVALVEHQCRLRHRRQRSSTGSLNYVKLF